MTRYLHLIVNSRDSWHSVVFIQDQVKKELLFWRDNLRNLRVPDCNFRESLAKLEKSKVLIICLKFLLLGNYLRKYYLNVLEIFSFREFWRKRNNGFCLINYAKISLKISQVQYACVETARNARKRGRF